MEFDYEYKGQTLSIVASVSPGRDATRHDPSEPCEIDTIKGYFADGTSVPESLIDAIEDNLLPYIDELASEDMENMLADAADMEYDIRREMND